MEHGTLCLTRKPNETLVFQYIDENCEQQEVTLTINQINSNQAKLMINAPMSMQIVRGELLDKPLL